MPSLATSRLTVVIPWRRVIDLIFPPRCGGCGASGSLWCAACQASLRDVPAPTCARCGEPGVPSRLCARCASAPLTIDFVHSMALYEGCIRQAIHRLKYQRLAALADPLGDALGRFWQRVGVRVTCIVPVPLHPDRQRERGYNQSELLARRVGQATGIPVYPHALRRVRATAAQMTLNAAERRVNVAGAFHCDDPALRGATVLLVDDVCTTASTLEACALALKAAGAAEVHGLTLAHTQYATDQAC